MKRIRFFFFLAIVYCILGPVLLFLETHLSGKAALEQALPIALLSVFFFAYSLASLTVFHKLLRNNGKSLTTYYLADKTFRLLLCMTILAVYGFLIQTSLLLFAINLFPLSFSMKKPS